MLIELYNCKFLNICGKLTNNLQFEMDSLKHLIKLYAYKFVTNYATTLLNDLDAVIKTV